MAIAGSMPPLLNLQRSSQSGSYVMTAAWQVVYTDNTQASALAYLFLGGEINLAPMAAGDTIEVRVRKIVVSGGSLTNHDTLTYNGPMPAGHPTKRITALPDVYGVEVSMRQTAVAAALLTIETEFYFAKRLGLS